MDVDDIGANETALLCYTNKTDCCGEFPNRAGHWYYPNGTRVEFKGFGFEFYRDRGKQVVRLHRQYWKGSLTKGGLFRCEVPDASNINQIVYANIGINYFA